MSACMFAGVAYAPHFLDGTPATWDVAEPWLQHRLTNTELDVLDDALYDWCGEDTAHLAATTGGGEDAHDYACKTVMKICDRLWNPDREGRSPYDDDEPIVVYGGMYDLLFFGEVSSGDYSDTIDMLNVIAHTRITEDPIPRVPPAHYNFSSTYESHGMWMCFPTPADRRAAAAFLGEDDGVRSSVSGELMQLAWREFADRHPEVANLDVGRMLTFTERESSQSDDPDKDHT